MIPANFFLKFFLTFKVIKNIHIFILDYFGLIKSKEVIYKTWNNLKFFTRNGTSDKSEIVIVTGGSEYPEKYFPRGRGLLIIDIGAHIGSFSAYLSRSMEADQPMVYAVEPSKDNFRLLLKNVELNNFKKIKCFNLAIGDNNGYGYIDLTKDFDAFTINETGDSISGSSKNSEKCQIVTLESFCQDEGINAIDLLKMDCEGGEHKIFNQSLKFIKEKVRSIFVEVHCLPGERTVFEFKQFLIENNFSVEAEIYGRTFFATNLNVDN